MSNTDFLLSLASLCKDKFEGIYPTLSYATSDISRRAIELIIKSTRKMDKISQWDRERTMLVIYFHEDYAALIPQLQGYPRDVPYCDPKFMDMLLFVLDAQVQSYVRRSGGLKR